MTRRGGTPNLEAPLTRSQLAQVLQVSERTIDRLRPPRLAGLSPPRYLWADVLDWLKQRGHP